MFSFSMLTILNYFSGYMTYHKNKAALIAAIMLDAGILILFKAAVLYYPYMMNPAGAAAVISGGSGGFFASKIIKECFSAIPLGMSFYIFKMISYQADLYTGKISKRPDFIDTAAYFTMFPQIAEGPIMRFSKEEFERKKFSPLLFEDGMKQMVIGFAMKVLLADRIGILWHEIGKIGYDSISTPLAWMGAYGYTFQLFFDFWGYSLMASGIGMMLGFEPVMNFSHPYAAKSIADFYRRWHMTLGTWFRDFIYIPLGGSRTGTLKIIFNLMIVWLLTGLWHGGTINFLIWGIFLGIMIVLEKFVLKKYMKKMPLLGHFHVWVLIPLSWVVFAIPKMDDLGMYFARLFPFFGKGRVLDPADWQEYLKIYFPFFIVSVILSIPQVYDTLWKMRKKFYIIILLFILFWISVFFAITQQSNGFMYFSF